MDCPVEVPSSQHPERRVRCFDLLSRLTGQQTLRTRITLRARFVNVALKIKQQYLNFLSILSQTLALWISALIRAMRIPLVENTEKTLDL